MSKEFICKGCGEKFNKDMQSSNVGYCYICNEFYMRKQIADLEAKLAESENEIKEWIAVRDDKNNVINKQTEKINQLKQQLAEKEKELGICRNQAIVDMQYKEFLELKLATIENVKNRVNCNVADNQDKISFAVEQLEKLLSKSVVLEGMFLEGKHYLNQRKFNVVDKSKIEEQIKDLKEGK